jgi:hypothetical protein
MEEIEKAANEIIHDGTTIGYFDTFAKYEKTGFIKGAKWQEKRMYSEEEVLDIFLEFFCHQIDEDVENKLSFQQFIKQFKKQ